MELFQKERNDLKKQISEKENILEYKDREIKKIQNREDTIKEYEDVRSSLKFNKIMIIMSLIAGMTIGLGLISGAELNIKTIFWSVIGTLLMGGSFSSFFIVDSLNLKRKLKKYLTQDEYEKLKNGEERDKQLKLSLEEEYTLIKQEIIDLKEILTWFVKAEDMQKLGYQVKLVEEPSYRNVEAQQKKVVYEQLWNEYLNEKIDYSQYSQVHFDSPEIDCNQKLVKKL